MTMEDWSKRLDSFIEFNGREILMDSGKISHEEAKLHIKPLHYKKQQGSLKWRNAIFNGEPP